VCTRRDGKSEVHFCRDIAVFDTAAEAWVRTIDMPPDMEGRAYHTASLVDGNKIWVVCTRAGCDFMQTLETVRLADSCRSCSCRSVAA